MSSIARVQARTLADLVATFDDAANRTIVPIHGFHTVQFFVRHVKGTNDVRWDLQVEVFNAPNRSAAISPTAADSAWGIVTDDTPWAAGVKTLMDGVFRHTHGSVGVGTSKGTWIQPIKLYGDFMRVAMLTDDADDTAPQAEVYAYLLQRL